MKVVKIATGITARKLNAAENASKLDALSRGQAMIEFTSIGDILTANESFLKARGYSPSTMLKALKPLSVGHSRAEEWFPQASSFLWQRNSVSWRRPAPGLSVTAEGVETEEQRTILANEACQEMQGYLTSKPMDAEHMQVFLHVNLGKDNR